MESIKESAANVAASARAGMEKTKATAQEKVEKATAHDCVTKKIAEEKKGVKTHEAELNKQEAREHNRATRQAATTTGTHGMHPTHATTTDQGYDTGTTHPRSVVPGHEGVVGAHQIDPMSMPSHEGVVGAHQIDTKTTTTTTTHHPHVGGV